MEMGNGMNLTRECVYNLTALNQQHHCMQIDNTTFTDLSIFHHEEEFSLFHKLNFTETIGGKEWLIKFFSQPLADIKMIQDVQAVLQFIATNSQQWPNSITNGTIMVIERYYESQLDDIPAAANQINGLTYKLLHGPDFALTRYSVGHFADFVRGLQQLIQLFTQPGTPALLYNFAQRAQDLLKHATLQKLAALPPGTKLTAQQTIFFGNYLRYRFKADVLELIAIYSRWDAWHSMSKAMKHFNLSLPHFTAATQGTIHAKGLYHLLLPKPVAYDVVLEPGKNFLFLTGANMAGKSTFIKSVGAAVYLAHIGMGVPAQHMQLSLFNGILSNINVVDNIVKGESYFFNEVQRIKNTISKINDGQKWLVLIDELFKGTNVQDAMKCSSTVIKGLLKIPNSLFILSTHLYEIGEELKTHPNIIFRYFETSVLNDQLSFSYQLKEGISNDRLGYLILKREKVIDLLESL